MGRIVGAWLLTLLLDTVATFILAYVLGDGGTLLGVGVGGGIAAGTCPPDSPGPSGVVTDPPSPGSEGPSPSDGNGDGDPDNGDTVSQEPLSAVTEPAVGLTRPDTDDGPSG
ncbi:hypothetical protein CDO52_23240 [Nocardiopsis gilva YIM 90087]|uniref:Uncharacterized protein n=1 Tax=Nocardiopsis gilva YIM 90087 TaxID=1235441 RepID=A0A223SBC4_9ACTN|nr:hypothetical protein [Nocardiopsis gilva]ASU85319.1 hypothetical protein CDO52_23240 [Nocardiopsis gilva YIM 90087]